jgi:hypothetical protein
VDGWVPGEELREREVALFGDGVAGVVFLNLVAGLKRHWCLSSPLAKAVDVLCWLTM